MRKSFPWHIISQLDFTPSVLQAETVVYNQQYDLLGVVCIDAYEHRSEDLRHQFDVTVNDARVGSANRFRIVFSDDGVLITIHQLGKDAVAETVKDFLAGRYDPYDRHPDKKIARAILKESVVRLLRSTQEIDHYMMDRPYPGIVINPTHAEAAAAANRILRQRVTYTIDLSQGRDVWIVLSLFRYEAHAVTFKYAPQCKKLLSLFLVHTRRVIQENVFSNAEVISVFDYFDWSSQENLTKHLRELASRIVSFQKYA